MLPVPAPAQCIHLPVFHLLQLRTRGTAMKMTKQRILCILNNSLQLKDPEAETPVQT